MKTQLAGAALFAATVSAVALYPALQSSAGTPALNPTQIPPAQLSVVETSKPRIDVVFALDTTSSMSGFIEAAKEKIWSIATTMSSAQPAPEIRIGLVAFRDRGDAYVTQITDLSDDLDSVYAKLMDFRAEGGGDGPESVNQALYDAVHKVSWSQDDDAYKVVFLVGDAPPHMDYHDDVKYPETVAAAARLGIRINTIQSGQSANTTQTWRNIASLSQGDFFNVAADGDAVAVATPFDKKIAALSRELDDTRLFFGDPAEQARQQEKLKAADKVHTFASTASRARRAAFNASVSGKRNFLGEQELVEAVVSGRVDLDAIAEAELPEPLQAMPMAQRRQVIEARAETRSELKQQITELAQSRDEFIAEEVAAAGGAEDSLDHKLYDTVRAQAAVKGLRLEAAPKY